jgi:hypothetical protein
LERQGRKRKGLNSVRFKRGCLHAVWRGLVLIGGLALMVPIWSGSALAQVAGDGDHAIASQTPGDGEDSPDDDCLDEPDPEYECPDESSPPSDGSGDGADRPPGDGSSGSPDSGSRDGGGGDGGGSNGGSTPPSGGGEHATAPPGDGSGSTGGADETEDEEVYFEQPLLPGIIEDANPSPGKRSRSGERPTGVTTTEEDKDLGDLVGGGDKVDADNPIEGDEDAPDPESVEAAEPVEEESGSTGPLAITGSGVALPVLSGVLLIAAGVGLVFKSSRMGYQRPRFIDVDQYLL